MKLSALPFAIAVASLVSVLTSGAAQASSLACEGAFAGGASAQLVLPVEIAEQLQALAEQSAQVKIDDTVWAGAWAPSITSVTLQESKKGSPQKIYSVLNIALEFANNGSTDAWTAVSILNLDTKTLRTVLVESLGSAHDTLVGYTSAYQYIEQVLGKRRDVQYPELKSVRIKSKFGDPGQMTYSIEISVQDRANSIPATYSVISME